MKTRSIFEQAANRDSRVSPERVRRLRHAQAARGLTVEPDRPQHVPQDFIALAGCLSKLGIGTTRMGAGSKTGVFGTETLYIASRSVFPTWHSYAATLKRRPLFRFRAMPTRSDVIHLLWGDRVMPAPLSMDVRGWLVRLMKTGMSSRAAVCRLMISDGIRLAWKVRTGEDIVPKPSGRPKGVGKFAPYRAFLLEVSCLDADITMPGLTSALEEATGVRATLASLSCGLRSWGWRVKKSLIATETRPPDIRHVQ